MPQANPNTAPSASTALPAATSALTGSQAAAGHYHEIVVSKALDGISSEAILRASQVLQDWVQSQAGYVSRELFEDAEQRIWIDHVLWRDEASAKAAMAHFFTAPCAHALDGILEMSSMQIFHAYARPISQGR